MIYHVTTGGNEFSLTYPVKPLNVNKRLLKKLPLPRPAINTDAEDGLHAITVQSTGGPDRNIIIRWKKKQAANLQQFLDLIQ